MTDCDATLLGGSDVRRLADDVGVSPRKSLGQNFVVDGNTIRRIVRLAELDDDEHVLEIGPGLGSLTLGLLAAGHRVTAIEIDPRLAVALPETVAEFAPGCADRLTVLQADAAKLASVPTEPTALVANLPYNVGVPILLHSLATFPSIQRGLVMVQTEVAQRLAAKPGEAAFGVPSLKLAWFAEAKLVGKVPAKVFWPVPRVESSLVAFRHTAPPRTEVPRERVFELINAAFGQRRKTLRASLSRLVGREVLQSALAAADIPPTQRPERLSLPDFVRIAEMIPATGPEG